MTSTKMHADEVAIDPSLVRRLLAAQFPHWAHLPLQRVAWSGTDNAIFRLGDEMAVRLPRRAGSTAQIPKESRWLPFLAPHLPLAIPVPLAVGAPGEGYAWEWCVVPWLPGDNATVDRLRDLNEAAVDLARFITALQHIDATDGPRPGRHNFFRGIPLTDRDAYTRDAIARSEGLVDTAAITSAWDAHVGAPAWLNPPVWVHGDLQSGNLIAVDGRLSGVIDFGGLGVGDPAVELMAAWTIFSGESRRVFRAALGVDDATWTRARGWTLSVAIVGLPHYINTNPAIVAHARHAIAEVLADL